MMDRCVQRGERRVVERDVKDPQRANGQTKRGMGGRPVYRRWFHLRRHAAGEPDALQREQISSCRTARMIADIILPVHTHE